MVNLIWVLLIVLGILYSLFTNNLDNLNLNYDECSYPIKNLKKRGIIECINPEVRTNKIYALSEKTMHNKRLNKNYFLP